MTFINQVSSIHVAVIPNLFSIMCSIETKNKGQNYGLVYRLAQHFHTEAGLGQTKNSCGYDTVILKQLPYIKSYKKKVSAFVLSTDIIIFRPSCIL